MIKFHYIILLIILFQPSLSFAQNFELDSKDYSGIDGGTKEKVFSSFAEQKSTFVPGVVLNEIFIRSLKSNGLRECAHQMNRRTELKIIGTGYKNE